MAQKTGGRLLYADVLRIFAAIAVIILHTSSFDWYSTPVSSYEWQMFNIYDSATRWCVPVFLMLSGMLFLNVEKPMPTSRIYLKYIPRILSALVFWGVFYGICNLINLSVDGYEAFTIKNALEIVKNSFLALLGTICGICMQLLPYTYLRPYSGRLCWQPQEKMLSIC